MSTIPRLAVVLLACGSIAIFATGANAQLAAGDVAIVGFRADGDPLPRAFAFGALVTIPEGTVLSFTEDGWFAAGAFHPTGSVVAFISPPGGLAAGSVVVMAGDDGTLDLATPGDQIFVFAGSVDGSEGRTATLLYSFRGNATGRAAAFGGTHVAMAQKHDSYAYTGRTTGTRAELLAAINDPTNWTGDDTSQVAFPISLGVEEEIFADDLESGCTGAWSATVGSTYVPTFELCGDGLDQDCNGSDAVCPVNDDPGGAGDISAGGIFTVDLSAAHNDQDFSGTYCGLTGGRDVFYTFTLPAAELVYLDTFGSNFDTSLRIFAGSCTALGAHQSCFDDSCALLQSQGVLSLAADTYCVVADQYSSSQTNGALVLNFTRGGRTGTALPASPVSGTSCSGANTATGTCRPDSTAQDIAYYFTACPAQTRTLAAGTCTGTTYDSVLYLRKAGSAGDIACNDDDAGCGNGLQSSFFGANAVGPGLFWLTVDGFATNCGAFTLTYTLN